MDTMENQNYATVRIRLAEAGDYERIRELGRASDMGELEGFDTTLVACLDDGRVAGFCRVRIHDGIAHVNPVVVDESLRGLHIGKRLMNAALERYGELRFVARGYAVPFYRRLGCEEVPWGFIAQAVASDCDGCDMAAACDPLPMRYVRKREETPEPTGRGGMR